MTTYFCKWCDRKLTKDEGPNMIMKYEGVVLKDNWTIFKPNYVQRISHPECFTSAEV